ncbi:MAG: hypothetical protein ACTSQG_10310 [Promethearchaeota archaeon]
MKLSYKHKKFLQTVYNYFKKSGEWPNSRKLAVGLRNFGDYYQIVKEIGLDLIHTGDKYQKDSVTKLTIEGIYNCEYSEEDLTTFINTIKLMAKKYINNPDSARITDVEIMEDLLITDLQAKRVCHLIRDDGGGIWSTAGYSKDKKSSFEISHDILKFENINSIEQFITISKYKNI